MLKFPVVYTALFGEASASPATECTPPRPAGTLTVILVDGLNAVRGVNTIESPMICQVPGTLGVRVGIGDRAAGGAEKATWTGRLPFAPVLPDTGVTDITRNGPGRTTPALGDGLPPPLASRYTPPPASSAAIAVTAAISRVFFDRPRLPSNRETTTPPEPSGWSAVTAPRAATLLPTRPPLSTFRTPHPITDRLCTVTVRYPTRMAITQAWRKQPVRRGR